MRHIGRCDEARHQRVGRRSLRPDSDGVAIKTDADLCSVMPMARGELARTDIEALPVPQIERRARRCHGTTHYSLHCYRNGDTASKHDTTRLAFYSERDAPCPVPTRRCFPSYSP